MSVRKLLLFLGVACVIAGLWLALVWSNRETAPAPQTVQREQIPPERLTALHPLPSGALLRGDDFGWKAIPPGQAGPGFLLRSEVSETEFLGAITRRGFAAGEPLTASELVKPSDRRFLAAVLRPGRRAVSISVDASQAASGLVLSGDYVDVILIQNFGDNIASIAYRSSGETMLRNVRVVAVDQSLAVLAKPGNPAIAPATEQRAPKTVTLEVDEQQAKKLFIATQLGKLQLAVRPLEGAGAAVLVEDGLQPGTLWASDVSRAIQEIGARETASKETKDKATRKIPSGNLLPASSGSTLESAIRYPPPYASR